MDVIEGLQNTSKGKLHYDVNWQPTRQELDQCSRSPIISYEFSNVIQEVSLHHERKRDIHPQNNINTLIAERDDLPCGAVLGPEYYDCTHVCLHQYEQMKELEVKQRIEERKLLFAKHSGQLSEEKKRTLHQQFEERRNKYLEEVQVLKQDLRNYEIETAKNQKALALQHEKSAARASKKVQHVLELKKKIAEEEERNRQELSSLQNCHEETTTVLQQLVSLITNCNLEAHLQPKTGTILEEARKVFDLSLNVLKDCLSEGKAVTGALEQIPEYFKIMKRLLRNAKQTITDAENKAKKEMEEMEAKKKAEEEKKRQQESKKKEEKLKASQALESLSTSIAQSSVPEYTRLEKLLEKVNKSLKALNSSSDKSIKKLRMALQRAVTTPINTISDQSPAHLLEKIKDLSNLLNGQPIESFGQRLSTAVNPSAPVSVVVNVMQCGTYIAHFT